MGYGRCREIGLLRRVLRKFGPRHPLLLLLLLLLLNLLLPIRLNRIRGVLI